MSSIKSVVLATLDEERVENSPHSWEEMFYKQLRVPACVIALLLGAVYLAPEILTLTRAVVMAGFVAYACLPAAAAYIRWKEGVADHE